MAGRAPTRLIQPPDQRAWVAVATAVALALFFSTLQTCVNGSHSPYTTDVGEIQNALPRWGTIHWTGYPLYTFLGSLSVTILRWVGIPPAAGASLFSALWGAASVGLLVALLQEINVSGPLAALGALVAAVSTSVWMDASLAEVHTMTTALTLATLWLALRFGRSGQRRDLLLLAVAFSQGVAHQRAVLFLAPAVAVLILRQWRVFWQGLLPAFCLSLPAPLTYLYLPLRVWQGATWTFGSPGTVQRLMLMLLDNRAERIVSWPEGITEWAVRIERAFAVTAADIPLPMLALGLLGLLVIPMVERRWREAAGLMLAWIPYILLTGAIWIGEVGDAQLAAHLPVTVLAAAGLALLADRLARCGHLGQIGATLALAATFVTLTVVHRPAILEVTRDPSAEQMIALAERISPPSDGRPSALMALWGNDYWALAYAQAFEGQLQGLAIVDHNVDFNAVLADGYRLLTFSKTFYLRPLSWWQQHLEVKKVYLSSVAPEIIEVALKPPIRPADVPPGPELDLGNDLWIRSARLSWAENGDLVLTVYWQAKTRSKEDYSVAVHLVAHDPPQGPEDVLSQTDYRHPVYGCYPISCWRAREIVRDHYQLMVPQGAAPQAVRVALYRTDASGTFLNTPWLSLPLPDR